MSLEYVHCKDNMFKYSQFIGEYFKYESKLCALFALHPKLLQQSGNLENTRITSFVLLSYIFFNLGKYQNYNIGTLIIQIPYCPNIILTLISYYIFIMLIRNKIKFHTEKSYI